MFNRYEHPDITSALETGYPRRWGGYEEDETFYEDMSFFTVDNDFDAEEYVDYSEAEEAYD